MMLIPRPPVLIIASGLDVEFRSAGRDGETEVTSSSEKVSASYQCFQHEPCRREARQKLAGNGDAQRGAVEHVVVADDANELTRGAALAVEGEVAARRLGIGRADDELQRGGVVVGKEIAIELLLAGRRRRRKPASKQCSTRGLGSSRPHNAWGRHAPGDADERRPDGRSINPQFR